MNRHYITYEGKEKYIHNIFTNIAPIYEKVNHMLSFNLDRRWRRRAVDHFFRLSHRQILDACCGTGELTDILLRRVDQDSSITGVDFCEDMLKIARERHKDVMNVHYEVANIQQLSFDEASFDAVYNCFALRNLSDISGAIHEMCRVIKPGGQLVIIDLTLPKSRLYRWYLTHAVPVIGRFCYGDEGPYSYLSNSVKNFCLPTQLHNLLVKEGLEQVEYIQSMGGLITAISGTKR